MGGSNAYNLPLSMIAIFDVLVQLWRTSLRNYLEPGIQENNTGFMTCSIVYDSKIACR